MTLRLVPHPGALILSPGWQDGRAAFLDGPDDVVHNARALNGIVGEGGVEFLNASVAAIRLFESGLADDEPMGERSLRGLGLGSTLNRTGPNCISPMG